MHKQKLAGPRHDTDPDALQRTIALLLEQISRRDQKILRIKTQGEAEVAERDALLHSTQALLHSTQALLRKREAEREAQLHEILTSRTWKIASSLQRVRTFFVPAHSRREAILQQMFRIVLSPVKKIRKS